MFAHLIFYIQAKFSLIPLQLNSKQPAIVWKPFQKKHASESQLANWFDSHAYGVGIVTGQISRLVVLDFDTSNGYLDFIREYPELSKTHVVRTRRGYHVYLRVPKNCGIRSQRLKDLDILYNGRYAVAPPTTIDGFTYRPVTDWDILELDDVGLKKLKGFIARHSPSQKPMVGESIMSERVITREQAIATYHRRAKAGQRNTALFQIASDLRDAGWEQQDVNHLLGQLHAQNQTGQLRPESTTSRFAEAARTIQSAFARPKRHVRYTVDSSHLPNTIREKILGMKLTGLLRVIEGLHLHGIQAGEVFSRQQALAMLAGSVGRDTVDQMLRVCVRNMRVFTPPPAPPPLEHTASQSDLTKSKNGIFDGVPKSGKNKGRPQNYYVMPSIEHLYACTGAKSSGADPITPADIQSAKAYRQALHKKHLERRPGQYGRHLLASRVGVSLTTIRRYDRSCGIQSFPMYTKTPLFAWNVDIRIPKDYEYDEHHTYKFFLEDRVGLRYPLKREIALMHIKQRRDIFLVEQGHNYYLVGESKPLLPAQCSLELEFPQPPSKHKMARTRSRFAQQAYAKIADDRDGVTASPQPPQKPRMVIVVYEAQHNPRWMQEYQLIMDTNYKVEDTPEMQQYWADQIYTLVNQRAGESDSISFYNAYQLVTTYGCKTARKALYILEQRDNIKRPAGFVVSVMRSEFKTQKRRGII